MRDRPVSPAGSGVRGAEWLLFGCFAAAAVYFVAMWSAGSTSGPVATDIYQYYYPNMLAALAALLDGGRGLLWNAYQNSGQPFFGIGSIGLLYPANAFFLVLEPAAALRAVIAFNLVVAGVSAYLLCRQLGVGILAAFCGALAFELANATVNVSTWTPLVGSPYVWFPLVMLFCERILRAPTVLLGLGLAVTLSITLLPGFPQTVFFMYQLVALRTAWEFATGRVARPVQTLLVLGLGLLAPPLLTAVQVVPAIESAWLSVRNVPLSASEIGTSIDWGSLQRFVMLRHEFCNPFVLVPVLLACASLTQRDHRRSAVFYLAVALLYFVLAFGPGTPVYGLYARLPLGTQFRMPIRFLWVVGFCLSVLTALGVAAILRQSSTAGAGWRRGGPLIAVVTGLVAFAWFSRGLTGPERGLSALAVGGVALAMVIPHDRRWAGLAIVAALVANLMWFPLPLLKQLGITGEARHLPFNRLLSSDALQTESAILATLRARMNPQERMYRASSPKQRGLGPKSASVARVPSVQDYEPQPGLRYARYSVLMRTGRKMESFNQIYLQFGGSISRDFQKRLLDLAAGRYLVVDAQATIAGDVLQAPTTLLNDSPAIRVYENPTAFPRARYVPRIEVVPDPDTLLQRLAFGNDDLGQLALVEAPLPSGFIGATAPTASGSVEFVVNDPERILLRVQASERGFLVLADQYFPGWTATVNGIPEPIVRANYAFRLVEVPAGTSTVEFRYAPLSVRIGAIISALSLFGAGALFVHARRRAPHAKTAGA